MSDQSVILEIKDHIAYLTLNRPEAGNLIDEPIALGLADACVRIRGDDDIYVALITGNGGHFCTGSRTDYKAAQAVAAIEQPVIVAINGDALGAGLELALAADIRLSAKRARFCLPQVADGAIPTDGGTQRLPRIVGRGKALEMILGARPITAGEALAIGLVHRVIDDDKLGAEAQALARSLAAKSPIAMRFIKETINKGLDLTLEQGLRLEADLYFLLHTTHDRTEGINAFLEKRQPHFKGE